MFDVHRTSEKSILNDLGRKEWEAIAYVEQSNTTLLKRPLKDHPKHHSIESRSGRAADHVAYDIARDTVALQKSAWDKSVEEKP